MIPDPAAAATRAAEPGGAQRLAEPRPAARPPAAPRDVHPPLVRRALRLLATARAAQQRAPRVVAVLRLLYYPAALGLVAYMGYQAVTKVTLSQLHWWPLVAAYGVALLWWLSLAFGWSALITERYRWGPVGSWCRTQVARYLPGGFWAPAARATTVQGRIRDKVAAVFAENVVVLVVSLAIGALWVSVHDPRWVPLVVMALLPLALARWLARRTKVTQAGVVRAGTTYAVGYLAYGVTGVLTQIAVSGVQRPTYPLYLAGASCIAWAAGLVVVFAPGGVGIREVVYVWMLSGLYPSAELKGAAVASRLVTVFAELTVLAAVSVAGLAQRRRVAAGPPG